MNDRIQDLLDKQEIYELICRYMRGLDRLDRKLLRSVYHDDATDDRGFFKGSADEFVELAIGLIKNFDYCHHMIGQALIEIDGDVAFGEIYFQAFHRMNTNGLEQDLIILGRYIDRYEKRSGTWKIAHRTELNDFDRIVPAADEWSKSTPEALRGATAPDDLSYKRDVIKKK